MLMAKVPKAQIKSGRRSHRADTESQSFYVKRRKIKLKSIGPSGSSDRTVTEWARAPKCTKSTRSLSTEYGVGSGCGFQHQKQRVEVSVTSTILQPLSHSPPNNLPSRISRSACCREAEADARALTVRLLFQQSCTHTIRVPHSPRALSSKHIYIWWCAWFSFIHQKSRS